MSRSDDQPSNAWAIIHDEDYRRDYRDPVIGHNSHIIMAGRERQSLAGDWAFTLDPFEEGLRQGWVRTCFAPLEGRDAPWDYDIANGVTAQVPGVWNLARDEWRHFEGLAWYGRWIETEPAGGNERVFLRVGAANYETLVFVNGFFFGRHLGGSTPFFVELTGHLTGRDFLHLAVDNRRSDDRVPMGHIDWFNYGGVFREVELVRLPTVFIRDAFIRYDPAAGGIAVDLLLSDPVDAAATLTIPDLGVDASLRLQAGQGSVVFATGTGEVALWSPEAPRLYAVEIACGEDRIRDRIGFRTIAVQDGEVLLNGTPLFLRGVCVHEDDADRGRVTDDADIERRIADAKALGCNMLRLAHYPHHERVAELADRHGLLLWAEIPVYWAIRFDAADTLADARNQLVELVRRDRNRASVVAWGVGNETADSDARLAFMTDLVETARAWDPTRLVAAACLVNKAARRVEDRLAPLLDLVGINEYYGWYYPGPEDLLAIDEAYDLPGALVITETGADARAGLAGDPSILGSEASQDDYFRTQCAVIAEMHHLRGLFPWVLYDFRTLRRMNSLQHGFNRKGLIAEDKTTRKAAFAALQDFYASIAENTDPPGSDSPSPSAG